MEASVARVRDYVRRQVEGQRVWRVGVRLTPETATVTLHTPDKPDRLLAERANGRSSLVESIEQGLKTRLDRDATVAVLQAPVAVAKFIRISPRKCRFVVDAIRGKMVQDALAILQFTPNSAAKTVWKLLKSAAANAENNHRLDPERLEVMHVHVDEGPALKRISPRAMGRAYRILKRTSHITIGLAETEKEIVVKPTGRGKGVAKTVSKTPRRAAKAEAEKPKRARKATPATAPVTPESEPVTVVAPEVVEAEAQQPEMVEAEAPRAEVEQPDVAEAEAQQPEEVQPEARQDGVEQSEGEQPESEKPEGGA